jgi:diamine N-acetyltransferase
MSLFANNTIFLRALEPEDLDVLYRWENDANLWCYGSTLTPYSRFALRDYITNALSQDIFASRQLRLMIVEKAGQTSIGTIDLYDFDPVNLRAGVGILIDNAFRKQGFGAQALQLMQEYARTILLLNQLYAYVPASNFPSYKLFQKSGYQPAGSLHAWIKTPDGYSDVYFMQLLL